MKHRSCLVAGLVSALVFCASRLVSAQPVHTRSGVVLESTKAYVINNSTDQKVFDGIVKRLDEWRRWELVEDQREADVIVVFADKFTNYGAAGALVNGVGTLVPVFSDQRFLVLVNPTTNENLVTISCERRLSARYTSGVLVNRLRDRILKDEAAVRRAKAAALTNKNSPPTR